MTDKNKDTYFDKQSNTIPLPDPPRLLTNTVGSPPSRDTLSIVLVLWLVKYIIRFTLSIVIPFAEKHKQPFSIHNLKTDDDDILQGKMDI